MQQKCLQWFLMVMGLQVVPNFFFIVCFMNFLQRIYNVICKGGRDNTKKAVSISNENENLKAAKRIFWFFVETRK